MSSILKQIPAFVLEGSAAQLLSVVLLKNIQLQMSPKVLALGTNAPGPIEFHYKTVLNKVMPAIQFVRYYFGNSFDAQFGSLTYHIVNGIMLEKFLFDLHRVSKRVESFGTHFQCNFNGKIQF